MENPKKQASYNDKSHILNKAYLIEPIIKHRIHDSLFYKQYLYLTNEETILPIIATHVRYLGSTTANGKPTPFVCCLLRLLELEPQQEVVDAYLHQLGTDEFKYLTALVMMYIRLVWASEDTVNTLEPFYADYRKLRVQLKAPAVVDGVPQLFRLTYMDVWCDELLTREREMDLILPRMVPRKVLQERELVGPREYHLESAESAESVGESASDASEGYESDSD